eukprot:4265918-Pleurochrysis_carterae.AAC.4
MSRANVKPFVARCVHAQVFACTGMPQQAYATNARTHSKECAYIRRTHARERTRARTRSHERAHARVRGTATSPSERKQSAPLTTWLNEPCGARHFEKRPDLLENLLDALLGELRQFERGGAW